MWKGEPQIIKSIKKKKTFKKNPSCFQERLGELKKPTGTTTHKHKWQIPRQKLVREIKRPKLKTYDTCPAILLGHHWHYKKESKNAVLLNIAT